MKKHVLIFPCGSENAINMIDSLKYNIHFELFGATIQHDHSEYLFDQDHLSIGKYNIKSVDFFDNFNKMLNNFNINFIIPTHDEIILFLIKNQKKINATVVASPEETCDIAFNKIKTFKALANSNYLPAIYDNIDKIKDSDYPVFIKPNNGAGGKGTKLINCKNEFDDINNVSDFLISEYLPGEEISVDCFTNKKGELLFIGPRTRERITIGISFRSNNIKLNKEIKDIAKDINSRLKFRGLWFFQLKKDTKGKYKLMEISVRCAGTMALYRQLGINFASLSLFDFMDYDLNIIKNDYDIELDRYLKSHYKIDYDYDTVYIDFDDTIIVNNKVNTMVLSFMYQCLNNNKKIILITKHDKDIYEDLKLYKIDKDIFYKIECIKESENKSKYIDNKKAIFIDNYYFDRKDVYDNCHIPVFDVDAIESLIDYKN